MLQEQDPVGTFKFIELIPKVPPRKSIIEPDELDQRLNIPLGAVSAPDVLLGLLDEPQADRVSAAIPAKRTSKNDFIQFYS